MRRIRARDVRAPSGTLLLTGLLAIGACDSGPPPIASIAVTPGAASMSFLGETVNLTATLTDEEGSNRTDVTPEWTSSNPGAVTVSAEGVATAVNNGTAILQASAGGVTSNPVTATVSQEAASIEVSGGDLEFSFLGESAQLSAVVTDQGGSPVDGASVSWISSNPAVASVGTDGTVTAVANGGTSVRANVDGVSSNSVGVTVEQVATVVNFATDELNLTFLGETSELEIVAEDAGGSAIPDAVAAWASSTPSVATVDAFGVVKAVTEGTTEVSATVEGVTSGAMTVSVELGTAFGARVEGLAAQQGEQFFFKLTVPEGTGELIVGIGNGNQTQDADLFVRQGDLPTLEEFDCVDGNQFADEICEISSPEPGDWFVLVDAFTAFSDLDLLALIRSGEPTLNIDVAFVGNVSEEVRGAVVTAVARWERALPSEVFGFWIDFQGTCAQIPLNVDGPVEDYFLQVEEVAIDGAANILARATPCFSRDGSGLPQDDTPVVGLMQIDQADVSALAASGGLVSTALHEIGHALGFVEPLWLDNDPVLVEGAGGGDPVFVGAGALQAFDEVGGTDFSGNKVPLQSESAVGHWRESVFDTEVMTPFAEGSGVAEPFSIVTLRAMADLGWEVNPLEADAYVLPGGSSAVRVEGEGMRLVDDIPKGGKRYAIDPDGHITVIENGVRRRIR